jgi:hypothetical protein
LQWVYAEVDADFDFWQLTYGEGRCAAAKKTNQASVFRDSLANVRSLRECAPALGLPAPSVEPVGFLFQGRFSGSRLMDGSDIWKRSRSFAMTWLHMIDPFTAVAMGLGIAMFASLVLAASDH